MSAEVTYQVNKAIGFSEVGSTHFWENIEKNKVPVYCEDYGEKYLYKSDGGNAWFDRLTGLRKTWKSEKMFCRNKRWYHFLKHWDGDYRKLTVSGAV